MQKLVIKNAKDLRIRLLEVFNKIETGEIKHNDAKEINNAAGKAIATVKLELEYAKLREVKPDIDFLDALE